MVRIRSATLDDQEIVFDLLDQLLGSIDGVDLSQQISAQSPAEEAFHQVVESDRGDLLLAEEEGIVLGLVTLAYPLAIRCGGTYSSIEEFIVKDQARGKGVGSKLLEAAISLSRAHGCREMVVNRPSDLGLPVYLRHGWKDSGKCLLRYGDVN